IQITSIGLHWPDINTDPNDFTLSFSADFSTAALGGTTLTVDGSVTNVVLDVGKLRDGEFPIVSLDDGALQVHGNLFGFGIGGTIIFGIVRVDANGDLINEERVKLGEDCQPRNPPEESTADPELDQMYFFGGLEGDILVAGVGFKLQIGVSELG